MKVLLHDVLKSKGKSQYWLSQKSGVTTANINNICNGKTTSIKFNVLEKICNTLECTPNEILICEKDDE